VKICGITSLEDARAALDAGADMLGFNFYAPSPRAIDPKGCADIVAGLGLLRPDVILVGVFVNHPVGEVADTLEKCRLHLAQLSGDEPAEDLAKLNGRAFKALRPRDAAALDALLRAYPPRGAAPAWLMDAYHPTQYGGTGQAADWSLATRLAVQAPVLLAGGLTPENVGAAVAQARPWGVDVASGVESAPGLKDARKMRLFVSNAREEHQVDG